MIRQIAALFIASSLVLFGVQFRSVADDAPAQTCLAEVQQYEASTNQMPDGNQKTKVLKRLHKAEKAAESDPNSSDCKHYLDRAKAGLGLK
jgi:hypothetical protein